MIAVLWWLVGLPFVVVMAGLLTLAVIVWSVLRMFRSVWPVLSEEGKELIVLALIFVVVALVMWQQGWFS